MLANFGSGAGRKKGAIGGDLGEAGRGADPTLSLFSYITDFFFHHAERPGETCALNQLRQGETRFECSRSAWAGGDRRASIRSRRGRLCPFVAQESGAGADDAYDAGAESLGPQAPLQLSAPTGEPLPVHTTLTHRMSTYRAKLSTFTSPASARRPTASSPPRTTPRFRSTLPRLTTRER